MIDILIEKVNNIGEKTTIFGKDVLNFITFIGELVVSFLKLFRRGNQFRWLSYSAHMYQVGVRAVPIIALISFLIGMVLAYQSINQLSRFGAEIYTIDFLGVSILREISVLLTAIVVAGRSGSAFTAQLGTMILNDEIDALRVMGLSPMPILILTRIFAILTVLPLLVFFSMVIALVGGMVMVDLIINVHPIQFWQNLQKAVTPSTFLVGLSKAPLFAIMIGIISCYRGLQVSQSAESVGKMTTQSVVESIFMVIVCDALMSIIYSYLGI